MTPKRIIPVPKSIEMNGTITPAATAAVLIVVLPLRLLPAVPLIVHC